MSASDIGREIHIYTASNSIIIKTTPTSYTGWGPPNVRLVPIPLVYSWIEHRSYRTI